MEKDIFRTSEEEAKQVAVEIRELKDLLREVSGKLGRIESRMKRAFPQAFGPLEKAIAVRHSKKQQEVPSFSPGEALKVYDQLVDECRTGNREAVQTQLSSISAANLLIMSRELGVTLGKKKPSKKNLTEAIIGRISQSVMLSKHVNRETAERPSQTEIPKDDEK